VKQILVKFKGGEKVIFDVNTREAFDMLARTLGGIWNRWIYIGPNAVVKKSEVEGIYFFTEGHAKSAEN
jgi:hypothetical protein